LSFSIRVINNKIKPAYMPIIMESTIFGKDLFHDREKTAFGMSPMKGDAWISNQNRKIGSPAFEKVFKKPPGCSKIDTSLPPQKAPRRRSSATPHKRAFEDGSEMAVFQQPL
jgi:hypothetical protein